MLAHDKIGAAKQGSRPALPLPTTTSKESKMSKRSLPSVDFLRSVFDYNPETGVLTWKDRPESHFPTRRGFNCFRSTFAGKPAGCKAKSGYVYVRLDGKLHKAHRVAFAHFHGKWPTSMIDHKNGIKDDNRIENLREATASGNLQNKRNASSNNKTSRLIGVTWADHANKWKAQIHSQGKTINLGYFDDKHSAHQAYLNAKLDMHPFYVHLTEQ